MQDYVALYKLIIVDDEKKMRDGLAQYVDWNKMGFLVVGKFSDGREAAAFIENNPVDVVLSDIRMTFVSGIELAKQVFESGKNIKTVLISGYKEFEYARQAMQYKVVDYLLKPVSIGELEQIFIALKSSMDKEVLLATRELREKNQLQEMLGILRREFFMDG